MGSQYCQHCGGAALHPLPAPAAPRLNPFAFPSDTDLRFALLIVAVAGTSMFVYADLYNTLFLQPAAAPGFAIAMLSGTALLFGVATIIYWLSPGWKIRRAGMLPLRADDLPEVAAYLDMLCREAELLRSPTFLWNPLDRSVNGSAFGRLRRAYVLLTRGLVDLFATDRPGFRAVVLHELAHIRNADLDKTYFAIAVWWAFLATALPPFVLTLVQSQPDRVLKLLWSFLALAGLVYLTRNGVLRAREYYADVRASVWDGPDGRLRHRLEALPRLSGGPWRSFWSLHPDPRQRRALLDDPTPLLRMRVGDAVATGMAATISMINVVLLIIVLLSPVSPQWYRYPIFGAALAFAPLAIGIAGAGVWRTVFAATACGEPVRGAGRLGFGLGLGMLMGLALSTYGASFLRFGGIVFLIAVLPAAGLWLIVLTCFFRWIAAGVSTWLEVAAASRSPRWFYRVGLTIAALLFLLIFQGPLYAIAGALNLAAGDIAPGQIVSFFINGLALSPFTTLALVILWAFPLAPGFWRERVAPASGAAWAFLDQPARGLALPRQPPLRPWLALAVGLGWGAVAGILLFIGAMTLARTGQNPIGLLGWGAILAPIVAAVVVAVWIQRLGGLHGLGAAFVTGCITALLPALWAGEAIGLGFLGHVNRGGMLVLFIAPGCAALARTVRRALRSTARRDRHRTAAHLGRSTRLR